MSFGAYLKHCRLAADLSFWALGKKIGVSGSYIHDLESGGRGCLSPKHFGALCEATPADHDRLVELWWEWQVSRLDLSPAERKRLEGSLLGVLQRRADR
jgi:transcriptional regulator with XRE-family HTH domain